LPYKILSKIYESFVEWKSKLFNILSSQSGLSRKGTTEAKLNTNEEKDERILRVERATSYYSERNNSDERERKAILASAVLKAGNKDTNGPDIHEHMYKKNQISITK
jgi:hypothetical protein